MRVIFYVCLHCLAYFNGATLDVTDEAPRQRHCLKIHGGLGGDSSTASQVGSRTHVF